MPNLNSGEPWAEMELADFLCRDVAEVAAKAAELQAPARVTGFPWRKARDGWSAKLARPIGVKAGPKFETLADVRAFVLNEPDYIQERQAWQRAAELLISAAEIPRV